VSEHFGWVEIVFTAIIALGFGAWQLWSVNREIRRDREAKSAHDAAPRSAGDSGHAVGKHKLDDR
jgi:hypothetical protein